MRSFTFYLLSLSFLLCSTALSAQQTETEPNNDFTNADPISFTGLQAQVTGSITNGNDSDYYKINILQSGVLELNVTNVPSSIRMRMVLFNPSQESLFSDWENLGQPVSFQQIICAPGVYYIRLDDRYSYTDAGIYELSIKLNITDIYECNNSFAKAKPIQLNTTVQGNIYGKVVQEDDQDFFSVEITQAGVLELQVEDVPSNIYMRMALYNPSQELIYSNWIKGQTVKFEQLICKPGKYYIRIDDRYGYANAGLYKLTAKLNTTDSHECNNSFNDATQLAICSTIQAAIYGKINNDNDLDYFSFQGLENQEVTISISNSSSSTSLHLRILDETGNVILGEGVGNGQSSFSAVFTPNTDGKYTILISSFFTNQLSPELYTLSIKTSDCATSTRNMTRPLILSFSPNPAVDFISIAQAQGSLQISSFSGQPLLTKEIVAPGQQISVQHLPAGIYVVQVQDAQQVWVGKLVKE